MPISVLVIIITMTVIYILHFKGYFFNCQAFTIMCRGEINLKNTDFSMEFKKLGLKIAYYRKVKGYTQEELSELMGVATSYLGAIEAPNMDRAIRLTTLFRIARILDIPAWKFLDFD